jgi:transcriptional regulator with XRE-family HTH domain
MPTLQDKFKDILKKSGLTHVAFARRYGISKTTVSLLVNGHKVGNAVIKKLVDTFGDDFEQYYTVTICEICGKEFIDMNGKTKFCSVDCQKEKIKQRKQRWVEQRDYVREMIKGDGFENPVVEVKRRYMPPEKTIGEFMNGKPYGERQREYLLGIQKTQRMEIR